MPNLPPDLLDARRVRRLQNFHDLMPFRVHDILLVSSLYDSFILAEDGQLSELILNEFLGMNLHHTPGLIRVSTGAEALERLGSERRFSLVLTAPHVGDMDARTLARRIRAAGSDAPVVMLAFNPGDLGTLAGARDLGEIDRAFLWQGDVRILVAIVKYVEDKRNVEHDTATIGVQSILLVEDNIRFYSSFLPAIYTQLLSQTQSVLAEGMNLSQKLLRMRARPKILLCDTYEEAWAYFDAYGDHLLGIISDIEFPRGGELAPRAGVELARRVREVRPDLPLMLQSSHPENRALARQVHADFLLKGSPRLLKGLQRFMARNFSFGEFVFRLPDNREVGRAADLRTLERKLQKVPAASLAYHGERNDFSNWLKARTEFALAAKLRPRKVEDFGSLENLRRDVIAAIRDYRAERDRVVVADFDHQRFDGSLDLYRLGSGSLGGKGRGLAFANFLLSSMPLAERIPGVRVGVPQSVVLGSDVFDRFLETNRLRDFALECREDAALRRRFLEARMPADVANDLRAYLGQVRYPLAVRSSSLLEDSAHQPLAGVYETYMLANREADPRVRLERLLRTIQLVYASTFSQRAKSHLTGSAFRLEEEKMAVVLQRIVGADHGGRFYPDFSGVARSHDFYPTGPVAPEDGVSIVALGLGKTVVEGETALRFCPRYPRHLTQFASVDDVLRYSQRTFWALDLADEPGDDPERSVRRHSLEVAEADGVLQALGSTYSPENDAIYDGLSRAGTRLVSFAPILKQRLFPLAEVLTMLLDVGRWGTASHVEIEFAVRLGGAAGAPREFGFLQMRPLLPSEGGDEVRVEVADAESVLCRSASVLGNGHARMFDAVVVDYRGFDRARSREAAAEVARFNARLVQEGRPYLLVGVGRWGSADPWLGIPVAWEQIAGARVIVESGFSDLRVTPSQGSHFFHNLASTNVGYFTVNPDDARARLDWDWLGRQTAFESGAFFRWLRFKTPLEARMNGRRQEGVIVKPMGEA